jgi:hypothetical protein
MSIRDLDLEKLNSATKYPSILTYHTLGEKGRLKDEVQVDLGSDPVSVTEKVDGVNARVIVYEDSYVIGSREELLHGKGDLIFNPVLGIVEALRLVAHDAFCLGLDYWVLYGEVYGGRTTSAAKQYTSGDFTLTGFRVFDIAVFDPNILKWDRPKIASWRDAGGQEFMPVPEMEGVCRQLNLQRVPEIQATVPPTGLRETFAWLKGVLPGTTQAALSGAPGGKPEGAVVRTLDRGKIAKLRFEDYERTLGK